ncbi:MAG: hypothetical protein V7750_11635 [Sneathiella sp.]
MVKNRPLLLMFAALGIYLLNVSLAQSTELKDMIELSVTGDAGQSFIGDCYLVSETGTEKRHRIKGQVPIKFWLPARAARCHMEKNSAKGKMITTITRNGLKEFIQRSRYPFRWVSISSAGPWGRAMGQVSAAYPAMR